MLEPTWEHYLTPNPELYSEPETICYVPNSTDPRQTLIWSEPKGKPDFPAVVWLHGGGLTGEGLDRLDCLYDGRRAVAAVRYRLSPAAVIPAPLYDVAAAVAYVAARCGGVERVVLGGMSAGAFLAALVGMDPRYLAGHGLDHRKLAGLLLLSGQMSTHFQLRRDLDYPGPELRPVIDEYAPLYYISAELPPIFLATGQHDLDMSGRARENQYLADLLRAAGHPAVECYEIPGVGHDRAVGVPPLVNRFLERVWA